MESLSLHVSGLFLERRRLQSLKVPVGASGLRGSEFRYVQ